MTLKEIYTEAIQKVIDGTLKKEELWDVFEEHILFRQKENEKLAKKCDEYEAKYKHLLGQVNSAHEEHKKHFPTIK